ncbi:MAG: DLW-39 family protein [bacterium]|nr:DLW-39 family protein [bacterium]
MIYVVQTLFKFVVLLIAAGAGLVLGKKYRDSKDSKGKKD